MQIPLIAPNMHNLNSLQELRAKKQENRTREELLDQTQDLYSWVDKAARYNDTADDHAQHDKHLVILDEVRVPINTPQASNYGRLSGEVRLQPNSDRVQTANIEVGNRRIQYSRNEDREVFMETLTGTTTKIVLDHKMNTLSWEY